MGSSAPLGPWVLAGHVPQASLRSAWGFYVVVKLLVRFFSDVHFQSPFFKDRTGRVDVTPFSLSDRT